MRRHLPRLLLTGALLSPLSVYALGLGEIRLNSALNQPFDADIEIVAPTREELAELKVGLASNDLFARYNLDRPAYLSNFQFAVARNRDGGVSIKVTSNRSVTEPFVTLLVEASWGRGRLLREYTVLLDPPVFTPVQPQTNQPVTAPQSGAQTDGRVERAPQPQPQPEAAPEPAQPTPAPEATRQEPAPRPAVPAAAGGTYEVERNDTLYRIARSVTPGASPSALNQTMIALFRANPEAFSGNNINRLRAGSILRIPDVADIQSVSRTEATAEVARQQEAWDSAFRADGSEEPNRLRLVTPAEAPPAASAAATPAKPAEVPAAGTAEAASGTAPANADKRLEVTSPGLASVQQNAAETPAQQAPQQPAAETPEAAQPPAAEQTPPAETQPTPAKPRPAVQPEQPAEPSLLERIGDLWWVPIAAGLLLVVGLILTFLRRRREASDLGSLDAFAPAAPAFEPSLPAALTKGRDRADSFMVQPNDLDEVEVEDEPLAGFDEPEPVTARRPEPVREAPKPRPEPVAAIESKPLEDTLSSETAVHFDQQDALAEADFHMAYGLYDQAADLVKIAIEREPTRRDLKLKLLEIYFVWGNRDLFLDTARDLHQTRDQSAPGEWDKVLIMGKQIAPEDQMFKGEAGARVDLVDVNLEGGENRVDVDLFAEPGNDQSEGLDLEFDSGERKTQPPVDLSGTDSSSSDSSDLDFLLDEPAPRSADDEPTREIDPLARTQETPTIESPMIDRSSQTLREKIDSAALAKAAGTEQTAELSLDDLGLDVDSLETTGALEQTASLEKDTSADDTSTGATPALRDDEMTQLAPSLGSFDRTMQAPQVESSSIEKFDEPFDIESTGTIYIDQVDLAGGDTVEQPRPDIDSTAAMVKPSAAELDVDLENFDEPPVDGDTVRHTVSEADQFSDDVFADSTSQFAKIDLDVGEALAADDHAPTNKQVVNEMELSELEPVTMSEVGTKLDLARAYMDMGDPDGARSILEEVLQEGTSNQKQEAQRLLDSIR